MALKHLNQRITNIIEYTPPGGQRVYLSPLDDSNILTEEGTGMPPIEYITDRGPFQHGVSYNDFFLQPRIVQYRLRQDFCSARAYQDGRDALLYLLRPGRSPTVPTGKLTKYLPNGGIRTLDVCILEGPAFRAKTPNKWDEWGIDEILRFIAFDPIYYDPNRKVAVVVSCVADVDNFPYTFPFYFAQSCQLTFPASFPIIFNGWDRTIDINYTGSWQEYPTIEIRGPAGPFIRITNETTGQVLTLTDLMIGDGEVVTITLAYGSQLVTGPNGENLLSHVAASSSLADFALQPGVNTMRVVLRSGGGDATVTFRYYHRFIGL